MRRLTELLDQRTTPLRLFVRDDDAGWRQDRLDALLELFHQYDAPIDLAVIPAVLTTSSADQLGRWRVRHSGVGLHQHGYAHLNHEPAGSRKCEFGPSRLVDRQCADIAMGHEKLTALLGRIDPIFTPPWNRCESATIALLPRLGFTTYSDDGKAARCEAGPVHVPVDLDWDRARNSGLLTDALARLLTRPEPRAGIMLHHATMDAEARADLAQFLELVRAHATIELVPMRNRLETMPCAI